MPDQAIPVSSPWRRFLRFSLRGLIVLVLVIGLWLGLIVRPVHVQQDAVAAITKAHGSVKYDWEWSNGKAIPGGKPWAPEWLVNLIGVDYVGHVTQVSYTQRGVDLALEEVADMHAWLEGILTQSAISTQLRPRAAVTRTMSDSNAMMVPLKSLTKLSDLDLSYTDVTDAGLAHLKGLTKLTALDLSGTQVSSAGLKHLEGLSNLTAIDLGGTRVTDAGLVHLKGLTNLTKLQLAQTRVSDAGLVHLRGLTNLSELVLRFTPVTVAGLVYLKGMTRLSVLDLYATYVTDDDVKELQQALPSLKIKL